MNSNPTTIRELRADYSRLRLLSATLVLCGGREGPSHTNLQEKMRASMEALSLDDLKFLELCPKCRGCGHVFPDPCSLDSELCTCHDGYVLPVNP